MTPDIRELTGLRGHYAGSVSRFLAYAIDLGVISGLFGLALAAVSFAAGLIAGHAFSWDRRPLPVAITYGCWWFRAPGRTLPSHGRSPAACCCRTPTP